MKKKAVKSLYKSSAGIKDDKQASKVIKIVRPKAKIVSNDKASGKRSKAVYWEKIWLKLLRKK